MPCERWTKTGTQHTVSNVKISSFVFAVVSMSNAAFAQGFVNLNFESTTITPVVFPGGTRYVATVPGWIWTPSGNLVNGDPNSVGFNEAALDFPAVDLQGTNSPFAPAIQGKYYSIFTRRRFTTTICDCCFIRTNRTNSSDGTINNLLGRCASGHFQRTDAFIYRYQQRPKLHNLGCRYFGLCRTNGTITFHSSLGKHGRAR